MAYKVNLHFNCRMLDITCTTLCHRNNLIPKGISAIEYEEDAINNTYYVKIRYIRFATNNILWSSSSLLTNRQTFNQLISNKHDQAKLERN